MSVRELYNAVAPNYDAVIAESAYAGPSWLERTLPLIPTPDRVIDFACANGALGRVLRRHFAHAHLIGIDVSDGMVRAARGSGSYDELRQHDLDNPLPSVGDASIQLAVALGFAEFLREPARFLAETARLLTPGGSLLMSFQEYWPDRPTLAPKYSRSGNVSYKAYSADEVRALILSHPFELRGFESMTGYVSRSGFACPYIIVRAIRVPDRAVTPAITGPDPRLSYSHRSD